MPTPSRIDLPTVPVLRRLTRSLAMLDAILSPDWSSRYYSFDSGWSPGEEMASMRDGCGDDWFLLFSPAGAALKGFAHESPAAARTSELAARVRAELPSELARFRDEKAFSMDDVTFCAFRLAADRSWRWITTGEADGAPDLLRLLDGKPASYRRWASEYYEAELPLKAVKAIYAHAPLSPELIGALNEEASLADLEADISEIGYPETPDRPKTTEGR